jgi:low affinity Fe/Cu permease
MKQIFSHLNQSLKNTSFHITDWMGSPISIVLHTLLFISIFSLKLVGMHTDEIMLILTTAVSLEAIYLSLFIQMTVNRNTETIEDVGEDIEEIQEDVEDVGEDIDRIQGDVDSLEENIEDISEDVDLLQDSHQSKTHEAPPDVLATLSEITRQIQVINSEISSLRQHLQPGAPTPKESNNQD